MDADQQERFAEAVERKKQQAAEASHHASPPEVPGGSGGSTVEQPERVEPGRTQDERSVRAKNTGHKKKTADKWNQ